jgi:type I restriction enzyme, S subunit
LAKAFRGELVARDPANEPASALLQKIKAESAKGGKKKEKNGQVELVF